MPRKIKISEKQREVSACLIDYLEGAIPLKELKVQVGSDCALVVAAIAKTCVGKSEEEIADIIRINSELIVGVSKFFTSRSRKLNMDCLGVVSDFYRQHPDYLGKTEIDRYYLDVHVSTGIPRDEDILAICKWKYPGQTRGDHEYDALRALLKKRIKESPEQMDVGFDL